MGRDWVGGESFGSGGKSNNLISLGSSLVDGSRLARYQVLASASLLNR
jgi:hypothetical protein